MMFFTTGYKKRRLIGFNETIYYLIIILSITTDSGIHTKVVDKDCLPLKSTGREQAPRRYQRLFLFSDSILKITPQIFVPLELTGSVATGATLAVPITVKFESQFDLMSDWVKQLLAQQAHGLAKNINAFGASFTQLFGLANPVTNDKPNQSELTSGGSTTGAGSLGADTSARTNGTDSDTNAFAANYAEPHIAGDGTGGRDGYKIHLQNQMANKSRAKARGQFYKSIAKSHSRLGKSCLQRAICEVSQTPLIVANTGLIGEILDMFLTVNSIHENLEDFEDYLNAQTIGQKSDIKHKSQQIHKNYSFNDECRLHYGNDCPFSLFNINHIIPINL